MRSTINVRSESAPLVSDITGGSLKTFSPIDIEYSDLEFMEKVGSGGFGTVSKGRWISKNKTVAIKMMMVLEKREVRWRYVSPLVGNYCYK